MDKKQQKKKLLYVGLSSLEDLARLVCNFDSVPKNVFASKVGKKDAVLAFGETIGDVTIAYYVEVQGKVNEILRYDAERGKAEFAGSAETAPNVYYMNVIGIDLSAIQEGNVDPKEVSFVRLSSVKDLTRMVISKSVANEEIEGMYSFPYDGGRVFCAFDAVEQLADDKKILYYAATKDMAYGGFARYDYSKNTVDFTSSIGEHTFLYVKIANLLQPFPFFKPE